jgi:hypothetical protein
MYPAVTPRSPSLFAASNLGDALALARRLGREALRLTVLAVGAVMLVGGFVLALLPGHLGLPLLVIGLIMVLRNSRKARRKFIHLQQRHPRVVYPVRRLIRRDPEIFPVLWQQALRTERLILPPRYRRAVAWRRRYLRAKRP